MIVAAYPGFFRLSFRGGEVVDEQPIIAWNIVDEDSVFPICAIQSETEVIEDAVLQPGGSVVGPAAVYKTRAEWIAGCLELHGTSTTA